LQCCIAVAAASFTALFAANVRRMSTSTHAAEVTAADFRALALGNPATPSLLQELDKMPFGSFEAHIERVRSLWFSNGHAQTDCCGVTLLVVGSTTAAAVEAVRACSLDGPGDPDLEATQTQTHRSDGAAAQSAGRAGG
jgi:hypothetical protein